MMARPSTMQRSTVRTCAAERRLRMGSPPGGGADGEDDGTGDGRRAPSLNAPWWCTLATAVAS